RSRRTRRSDVAWPTKSLEVELACHLHRAIATRAGDLAEAGAAEAGIRIAPLRRVCDAVSFQPQLHVLPLRDSEVLHQCGIFIDEIRSAIVREKAGRVPNKVRSD